MHRVRVITTRLSSRRRARALKGTSKNKTRCRRRRGRGRRRAQRHHHHGRRRRRWRMVVSGVADADVPVSTKTSLYGRVRDECLRVVFVVGFFSPFCRLFGFLCFAPRFDRLVPGCE